MTDFGDGHQDDHREAVERASRLKVMAVEAGNKIPAGFLKVTFSDQTHLMITRDQYDALRTGRHQ